MALRVRGVNSVYRGYATVAAFLPVSGEYLDGRDCVGGSIAGCVFLAMPVVGRRALQELSQLRRLSDLGLVSRVDGFSEAQIWNLTPFERGVAIEHRLALTEYADWGHIGRQSGGYFPLIDFVQGTRVVSIKSVDRVRMADAIPDLKNHIRDLRNADITVGGARASVSLDVRVRAGRESDLQSLVAFGDRLGVPVKINAWP